MRENHATLIFVQENLVDCNFERRVVCDPCVDGVLVADADLYLFGFNCILNKLCGKCLYPTSTPFM